jgi:hypothetical protein
MLESPDAAQVHPLSILVVGLIFGFITYGILSLIERAVRGLLPHPQPTQPEAEFKEVDVLMEEQPLALSADDSSQQKNQ